MAERPDIEVRTFKSPNQWAMDYWVKIPLSEQMLYEFWKREEQPNLDRLVDLIAACFTEWLEESSGHQLPNG